MALLGSCWYIVESIVIPDGSLKWFYLSFYIHPIFLFLTQIFLWLKLLQKWLLFGISYLLTFIRRFSLGFHCVLCVFSFITLTNDEAIEEAENYAVLRNCKKTQNSFLKGFSTPLVPTLCQAKYFELDKEEFKDSKDMVDLVTVSENENEDKLVTDDLSFIGSPEPSSNEEKADVDDGLLFICSSTSPADHMEESWVDSSNLQVEEQLEVADGHKEEEQDAFYKKYTERMRWFDALNQERTCGINAILDKRAGTPSPSSFHSMKPEDSSVRSISWIKRGREMLLRSLESDFELVYVAQSCLTWDALHHQYRKVEALASSGYQNAAFCDKVAGGFQKFQVLIERFMEDERCEGKRVRNYVRSRVSCKSLLHVPDVSLAGFFEQEQEKMKGEAVSAKELLKAIEKCIHAFWIFVKIDNNKKRWWKSRSSLWTCPPVEDPRDLQFLSDLTGELRKKELWLKDSQGKQRRWFRRANLPSTEGSWQRDMLFTMIDLKLISRVLRMSVVSTSQLRWCQEKLDNIEIREGNITRACTSSLLFPS